MKTTEARGTLIDESRTRETTAKAAVKPAVKDSMIFIDGKFYSQANAKISLFNHGLLYGDGIFEGIRFYNGRVFRLEEHLDRLWDSARSICLEVPIWKREMTVAL